MIRKDAIEIKDISDPFHSIVPYVMPKRTEAEISANAEFDVTNTLAYIENYNNTNNAKLKLFHVICYAVGRTITHRPKLNIFIAGKKFWQRKDITLSFVAKQYMGDEAQETLMVLKVKPDQTIKEISQIITGDVKTARSAGSNSLDDTMNFVGKLPRFVLVILFYILSRLEYHGIFPESLKKGDPNYTSCLLSNLGSIKACSCYHHLSNYGTNSLMITIGTILERDGKSILPMTITLDERIADGFYFAKSLRLIKLILEQPEMLLETIDNPVDDSLFN